MKKFSVKTSLLLLIIQAAAFAGAYFFYSRRLSDDYLPFFLIGIVLLEIAAIFLIYSLIKKKNIEIESSRSKFLREKAYLARVSAGGKIKEWNLAAKNDLRNLENLQDVRDFDFAEGTDLEALFDQPFIALFEGKKGKLRIRFRALRAPGGYLLVGEDVTETAETVEYYRKLAMDNAVTGLPNKNFLVKRLESLFQDRELLQKKNTLLEIDIQDFKRINRLYGVKFGDEVLLRVAEILEKSLKSFRHEIYHLHADDFLVLFLDLESYQQAVDWVERLIKFLEKALSVAGNLVLLDVKIGIFHIESAIYPNLNPAAALENVSLALKKAKGSRRVDYIVYDMGLGQHFTRLQAMESDLMQALKNNELVMYYQPQVYNNRRRVYGFEALVRWNNPKYFLESPLQFIRLAEENNLIVDLGRFVIDETFRFAKEIEPYNVKVSLNISPVQVLHAGFVNEIETAFRKYNLQANSICIEISDTSLLGAYDLIIEKLSNLKKLGLSIRLDNFGSESTSLANLRDLPVDGFSIGHAYIRDINTDAEARAIVANLIKLADDLNLEVVAEGVENDRQNRFLSESGCRIVQGYLISKPLPRKEAMKFLTDYDFRLSGLDELR